MTIEELHQKWLEAEIKNPLEILDYCTEGVEFFPEGTASIKGKKSVSEWIQKAHAKTPLKEISVTSLDIMKLGSLASLTADFETSFDTPESSGKQLKGKHMWQLEWIYGEWKVAKLSWEIFNK